MPSSPPRSRRGSERRRRLPGGTGNGFAREVGIPKSVRTRRSCSAPAPGRGASMWAACAVSGEAHVDDKYFIQRLYIGIEPEEQTSRELKHRYGVFAYAVSAAGRVSGPRGFRYQVDIDGEVLEFLATQVYMVNSGKTGRGSRSPTATPSTTGLRIVSSWTRPPWTRSSAAAARALDLHTDAARRLLPPGSVHQRDGRARPACLGRTASTSVARRSRSMCFRGALTVVVP